MIHRVSTSDIDFQRTFEACATPREDFDHAAHVRLAYVYLCDAMAGESGGGEAAREVAARRMKAALLAFLAHLGIGEGKYHETMTRAWIMAVDYFMSRSPACSSAAEFMAANPILLDSRIMLSHYSAEVLFSPEARQAFVSPDIQSIPPDNPTTR